MHHVSFTCMKIQTMNDGKIEFIGNICHLHKEGLKIVGHYTISNILYSFNQNLVMNE